MEELCKWLLLCLSYCKCTSSAPRKSGLSRRGFRGESATWPQSCVCCGKGDPWKPFFSLQTPPYQGLFPTAGLSLYSTVRWGVGEERKEISVQGTHIKRWETALKGYMMVYPHTETTHREGFSKSLWVFAPVLLRAGHWQIRISRAAGTEPSLWRMQPESGLNFFLLRSACVES